MSTWPQSLSLLHSARGLPGHPASLWPSASQAQDLRNLCQACGAGGERKACGVIRIKLRPKGRQGKEKGPGSLSRREGWRQGM